MDEINLLDKVEYSFFNPEKPDITDRENYSNCSGVIWYDNNDSVIGIVKSIEEITIKGFDFETEEYYTTKQKSATITGISKKIPTECLKKI